MAADTRLDQDAEVAGAALADAAAAVVLLHGRGGSPDDILPLGRHLTSRPDVALLAPRAAGGTWYPLSFLAPRSRNEPHLSAALETVARLVGHAAEAVGARNVAVVGFSQGACLAAEFVARRPAAYAGLVCFTGGLIGDTLDASYPGDLARTPALLTGGDPDPHVPWRRVEETAAVLRDMNARVETKRFAGKPHSISAEEVAAAADLLAGRLGGAAG